MNDHLLAIECGSHSREIVQARLRAGDAFDRAAVQCRQEVSRRELSMQSAADEAAQSGHEYAHCPIARRT